MGCAAQRIVDHKFLDHKDFMDCMAPPGGVVEAIAPGRGGLALAALGIGLPLSMIRKSISLSPLS
jgi:hypothetical protein